MTHEKETLSIRSDNDRSQIFPKPQREDPQKRTTEGNRTFDLSVQAREGVHINAVKFFY